jgi:S-adenosylmethionine-diacylglycerol 3-amino-3-carboxypropyl transferase
MQPLSGSIRQKWFEIRIFISLSIVLIISLLSFLAFKDTPVIIETAGQWIGLSSKLSIRYGFIIVALLVIFASLIRMWGGSVLTSRTVMSFRIQDSRLLVSGPYVFVRNPIYFADLIAFTSLSFCLRPIGLLIPLLIYLHYLQLIKYEEETLKKEFGQIYMDYIESTPAILPGFAQIKKLYQEPLNFFINFDGFRHNAQYILFIPGLIVAAFTGKFIHAIIIGLPAVIDWAVVHTVIGVSPDASSRISTAPKGKKFSHSKVFRDILYAQCWEDPEIDRIAFKIHNNDTIFSITSGGCNALTFLIDDPEKVICLDLNRYQNYLLSLKICAFRNFSYNDLLEFLGVRPSERRLELFEKLKPFLPDAEQSYWSNKTRDLNCGIIHCGRYERYMHLLKNIFRILIGKRLVNELFASQSEEERVRLFNEKWDNLRWRFFCSIFLSRTFASLLFDRAFYKYLDPSFSFEKYYRSAIRRAVTELPVKENYFLAYILLGNYFEDNLPAYLEKENFETIRSRLSRIELVTSGCFEYFRTIPEGTISKFNFTNIFEWMSLEEFKDILAETIRVARDGAIITYRNHLVTRSRPESLADKIIPVEGLSSALHERDRSFIYKAYIVEQIRKQ